MKSKNKKADIEVLSLKSIDTDKFDRQKRIKGWDQKKIVNAKVMVIGVGATGNEVVKNLVLAGVGTILIIDYDLIELSNLNRCVLFSTNAAMNKEYKVDVVKEAANILNPEVEIITIKQELNAIDKKLYDKYDVVCSCLDNIEARVEANNYSYFHNTPFIDSGIDGYFGTVQAVYSKMPQTSCLQCGISNADLDLMWKKFSCTGQEISSENGETTEKIATLITTTSVIGGLQSQQVLKFILGVEFFNENGEWNPNIGAPLIGKQLNYNGLTNKFNIIEKFKDPNCWTCSYEKSTK
ncbi:MAG: HesA/MoeB/ThiF family protein [Promethearchaeota archaeon]|jgi:molybdopterin/thiamine biosynthesis adenylyltransferase